MKRGNLKLVFIFVILLFIHISFISADSFLCSDSDSGLNYYVKGRIKGNEKNVLEIREVEKTDFCFSDRVLTEYYCEKDFVRFVNYRCFKDYECKDGKCALIIREKETEEEKKGLEGFLNAVANFFSLKWIFQEGVVILAEKNIGISVVYPEGNVNVSKDRFFNVTFNISCLSGSCGEINVSLDPKNWWDYSYSYRKKINLSVFSGATSQNYQANIILNSTNTGNNFTWSRNCDDIRFVNKNKIKLDYWIESCNSLNQNASIWVEIDNSINVNGYFIYMYYGNANSVNESNGTDTFEIFDDFNDNFLDENKWINISNGPGAYVFENNGFAKVHTNAIANTYSDLISKNNFSSGTRIKFRANISAGQSYDHKGLGFLSTNVGYDNGQVGNSLHWRGQDTSLIAVNKNASFLTTTIKDSNYQAGFREWEIQWLNSQARYYFNNIIQATHSNSFSIPSGNIPARFSINSYTYAPFYPLNIEIDWIYVTKYSLPEPYYIFGSEESSGKGLISTITGDIPFYTITSNPFTTSFLNQGESEIVVFWVNATGNIGESYEFFGYANLTSDLTISNISSRWDVTIQETDNVYPLFSNYKDNSGFLVDNGTGYFNVTIENTNGIVYLNINGQNIKASNLSSNIYNASYIFSASGIYSYNWSAYGDGLDNNFNVSENRNYKINESIDNNYPLFSDFFTSPASPSVYVFNQFYRFNATVINTNGTVGIEFNGINYSAVNLASDVYNINMNNLAEGSYSYYYWSYGNGKNNLFNRTRNFYYSVDKGNPESGMQITGTSPLIYPSSTDVSASENNSGDNGCVYSLNRDNRVYGAGNIIFNYSTSGCENYTSGSRILNIVISKNSSYNLVISGTSSVDYGISADILGSGCPGELNCNLYRNNILVSNPDNRLLGAGSYNYVYNTTGNENYSSKSVSKILIVNKKTTLTSLTTVPPSPIIYPTANSFSCSNSEGLSTILYINEIDKSNEKDLNIVRGAGNYIASCNFSGNENYSSSSQQIVYVINKNDGMCRVLFDKISPLVYLESFRVYSECSSSFSLYKDGNMVANNSLQELSAGNYNFRVARRDAQNYTNANDEKNFVINKANSLVHTYLNNSRRNILIHPGDSIFLNSSLVSGEGKIRLYKEGDLINSGNFLLSNLSRFNDLGLFNITTIYEESENYSSSYESWWVNVSYLDLIYPLFFNYSDNNKNLTGSGFAFFNTTIINTNGSVFLEIGNAKYIASNFGEDVYGVSVILTSGSYSHRWLSWGNGSNNNFNASETRIYTVLEDVVTPPGSGGGDGGGGGSLGVYGSCKSNWSCDNWSGCFYDLRTRLCKDKACKVSDKIEVQECVSEAVNKSKIESEEPAVYEPVEKIKKKPLFWIWLILIILLILFLLFLWLWLKKKKRRKNKIKKDLKNLIKSKEKLKKKEKRKKKETRKKG